jgi:hypothetical protein
MIYQIDMNQSWLPCKTYDLDYESVIIPSKVKQKK